LNIFKLFFLPFKQLLLLFYQYHILHSYEINMFKGLNWNCGVYRKVYKCKFQFPLVNFSYISVFLSFCLSIFLSIFFAFWVCFYVFFRLKSIFDWIFEIPFRRTQSDLSHFLGLNWKLKSSPFFILKIFSFLLRHKWWQQQKSETRSTPPISLVRNNLSLKK
jgi:hypothetical protein